MEDRSLANLEQDYNAEAGRAASALRGREGRCPPSHREKGDAGHGFGSTKSQGDSELADELSFLFWQFGVSGFQPTK